MPYRHQTYFEVVHPCYPMIDQDRFLASYCVSPRKAELSSLSNAMAMLGASITEGSTQIEEQCYRNSRTYLEMIESQEDGEGLLSLQALQASLLITLYENKKQNFARAWMSLGRAIRLTLMLGLHRMDLDDPVVLDSGFQSGLPESQNWTEMEERRRTFWVTFNLDWYASVRTGSAMLIEEREVTDSS